MLGGRLEVTKGARLMLLQEVPEQLRANLVGLQADRERLVAALLACNDLGWSARALAEALGRNLDGVGRALSRARSAGVQAEAPFAIPRPRAASGYLQPELPHGVVAHLIETQKQAAGLRGAVGRDDPRRQASAHFAADTNALISHGFSVGAIARALDVRHRAITQRLERYGFRTPAPTASVPETPVVAFEDLAPLRDECPVLERAVGRSRG